MDLKLASITETYNNSYRQQHYFRYREWLYRPFLGALRRKAGLQTGSNVLDAGCGQGFFTSLFAGHGLKVVGIDVSKQGILAAHQEYGHSGASFEVGDVLSLQDERQFDCVFARSLSAYNSDTFAHDSSVTKALLGHVKIGGILIFDYHTKLRRKSELWRHHSLAEAKMHFAAFPGARVYFSLRLETLLLGRWALSSVGTQLSSFVSRVTGFGGELIAIVPRS
jgi:2-polyprenyl-3-methyl-5-hydroxy-6-metoxy-1,4-benzoquinol methylase